MEFFGENFVVCAGLLNFFAETAKNVKKVEGFEINPGYTIARHEFILFEVGAQLRHER